MPRQIPTRGRIEAAISEANHPRVISLHTDMSTKTGERIIVLIVDANLEAQYD